jgi:hypothetical protein
MPDIAALATAGTTTATRLETAPIIASFLSIIISSRVLPVGIYLYWLCGLDEKFKPKSWDRARKDYPKLSLISCSIALRPASAKLERVLFNRITIKSRRLK